VGIRQAQFIVQRRESAASRLPPGFEIVSRGCEEGLEMHAGRLVAATLAIEKCEVPMRDRVARRLPQHSVQRDRRACRLTAAQIVDGATDQALDAGL